jgi:hypothetical protein
VKKHFGARHEQASRRVRQGHAWVDLIWTENGALSGGLVEGKKTATALTCHSHKMYVHPQDFAGRPIGGTAHRGYSS